MEKKEEKEPLVTKIVLEAFKGEEKISTSEIIAVEGKDLASLYMKVSDLITGSKPKKNSKKDSKKGKKGDKK